MQKEIHFYKYHGAGNDFVMIDNRGGNQSLTREEIFSLCHRRFGIGADGLIFIEPDEKHDFKMKYYNADGNESTMCGNGGRCIVAFARDLGMIEKSCTFDAIDGLHEAQIDGEIVNLKMKDVTAIEHLDNGYFIDTGSPHHIEYHENIEKLNVYELGKKIRHSQCYEPAGTNVNFVQKIKDDELFVRTFERGVEDETLACGTGATAAAIALMLEKDISNVKVKVMGGDLEVSAKKEQNNFVDIWLKGPAVQVFKGKIRI